MSQETEMLKMDGYDDCVVGVVSRCGFDPLLAYSEQKIKEQLMAEGCTEEEALEHIDYNMRGSYVGPGTPLILEEMDFAMAVDSYGDGEGFKASYPTPFSIRRRFKAEVLHYRTVTLPSHLVMAVKLPTGAVELITNTAQIDSKFDYYLNAYDDEFRLKTNPLIQVVGYMIVGGIHG